ncbi:MAG: hypothetical protein IKS15_02575 [Opitutales bacterium]|nr:hypothetical protein [Opitutales bacterium]
MKTPENTSLTAVESALQGQCKGGAELAKAFYSVEEHRGQWLTSAIMFGLWASVMKAEIGHGKFLPWLRDVFKKFKGSKCATCCTFDEEKIRTAQFYMSMARKLLYQIEEPHLNSEIGAKVNEICLANKITKEALPEIFQDKKKTIEVISKLVEGYSLRSLNAALTEANREVLDEEEAAEKSKSKTPISGFGSGSGKGKEEDDPQMLLWEDWTNEFERIDELIKSEHASYLDAQHWFSIEAKLTSQLTEIKKITAAIRKNG